VHGLFQCYVLMYDDASVRMPHEAEPNLRNEKAKWAFLGKILKLNPITNDGRSRALILHAGDRMHPIKRPPTH
jgi:hypothetical protein